MSELQESKFWSTLNPLPVCEVERRAKYISIRALFPNYTRKDGCAIIFELILFHGERVQAWVDESQQYTAEGSLWRKIDNNDSVSKYHVVAWKEVE